MLYLLGMILGLVADPVIRAIGMMMFEEGSRCCRGVCFKPSVKGKLEPKVMYRDGIKPRFLKSPVSGPRPVFKVNYPVFSGPRVSGSNWNLFSYV